MVSLYEHLTFTAENCTRRKDAGSKNERNGLTEIEIKWQEQRLSGVYEEAYTPALPQFSLKQ